MVSACTARVTVDEASCCCVSVSDHVSQLQRVSGCSCDCDEAEATFEDRCRDQLPPNFSRSAARRADCACLSEPAVSLCVWLGKRHPVVLDADHADAIETLQEQHDVTCWSAAGQIHLKTLQTRP